MKTVRNAEWGMGNDQTLRAPHFTLRTSKQFHLIVASLILICLVFAIYIQTVHFSFINYDDDIYVSKNPYIAQGFTRESIRWAWEADLLYESPGVDYWQPLSVFSRLLDAELYGMNAGGHHFTNVLLHAANAVLLFIFLLRATSAFWPSFFTACIFAAHPIQVDAVAWVTARKDLLSTFFGFLSLLFYDQYARRGRPYGYWVCAFFFACSLMSKPAFAMLPVLFLILDVWLYGRMQAAGYKSQDTGHKSQDTRRKLGALSRLIAEKWVFLALVFLSALTIIKGRSTAVDSAFYYMTAAKVPVQYLRYLMNFFYPANLVIRYPELAITLWMVADSLVILCGISYGALRLCKKYPYLLAGWLWFLSVLFTSVALDFENRYVYVPIVGLAAALCFGLRDLFGHFRISKMVLTFTLSAVTAALALVSWVSASAWENSHRLFSEVIRADERNPRALNNLATSLAEMERFDEAVDAYTRAIWMWPDFAEAHNNLGVVLMRQGKDRVALTHLRIALQIKPDYDKAHNNMSILMRRMGELEAAVWHGERAFWLAPELLEARFNLAVALADFGRYEEAVNHLQFILKRSPRDSEALSALGYALEKQGSYEDAVRYHEEAIRLAPDFEEAYNNLGNAYAHMGRVEDAVTQYRKALAVNPYYAEAHNNLAVLLSGLGRHEEAVRHFQDALRLKPDYSAARQNLRLALSKSE